MSRRVAADRFTGYGEPETVRWRSAPESAIAGAAGMRLLKLDAGSVEVDFAEAQRAAVAGQYLVLYDGEEMVWGGGEILHASTA